MGTSHDGSYTVRGLRRVWWRVNSDRLINTLLTDILPFCENNLSTGGGSRFSEA